MTLTNSIGLLLVVTLLGNGIVAIPQFFQLATDIPRKLKHIEYKTAIFHEKRTSLFTSLAYELHVIKGLLKTRQTCEDILRDMEEEITMLNVEPSSITTSNFELNMSYQQVLELRYRIRETIRQIGLLNHKLNGYLKEWQYLVDLSKGDEVDSCHFLTRD